jgi:DNA polymerase III subunit delta
MKIQPSKIEEFIEKINKELDIKGALVYGTDNGLISLYYKRIAQKIVSNLNDPFNVVQLSEDILKERPSVVFDEFLAMSMLGGRRLIIIKNAGNILSSTLKNIFKQKPNNDNFILITAENLDKKSNLRQFAETSKYFVAIPCYQDDKNKIMQIVNQKLHDYGFIYSGDVVKELVENFGGDRLIILSEIEKLALYKGNDKRLTLEDTNKCIKNVCEANINDLINECVNRNSEKIYSLLKKIFSEETNFIVIIRSFVKYFIQMQRIKFQLNNGLSFIEASKQENIFWKQVPILQKHLNLWNLNQINFFLKKLAEVEVRCKSVDSNSEIILERFLIGICQAYKKN